MKPILLQMQAFGPFAGKETISFADLGASPLFLINGPTGAGKTTILDAISYALYGSTTGNERDARDMRCQQSDPGLQTEVILEFSLGGASYRISRSPDQLRPKKRGEGFTLLKSCASLYKLGADGSSENGDLLVEQKISDATDHIRSITGLNAEQFRQVMVLPQGQFRKLLMADSKGKQDIFESLFQTSIYSKIEERLKEDSRDVRDARKHAESVISNILGNGGVKTELELDEKIEATSAQLKILMTTRDDSQSAWTSAEKALHDANKLKEQFDELDKVTLREAELEADSEEFEAERKRATQAHSAFKLMPIYGRVGEAELVLQKTKEEISEASSLLAKTESSFTEADSIYQKEKNREAERASAASKVNELKSYAGKAEELTAAKAAFEAAQKSEATEKTRRAGSLNALNEHLPLEQKIQTKIDSLQQEIATADGIDVTVHKLDEALLARKKISALRVNLVQAQDALRKAETHSSQADIDCSAADKELKRMRQAWHQGQAALLAKELEDESPCPVCGSTEHPLVATTSSESISDEQLEASTLELENKTKLKFEARGNVTSCAQHVSAIEADIAQSESRLGKQAEQSEDDIAAELSSAQKVAHKLRDDVDTLEVERQSLKNHGVQTAELRENAELAKATFEKALLLTGKAQTRCELSEKLVPEAYRTVGALEKELRNNKLHKINMNNLWPISKYRLINKRKLWINSLKLQKVKRIERMNLEKLKY